MFKNIKYLLALFLLSTLTIQSCQKDSNDEAAIDELLQPYFNKFQVEAALRGIEVDFETNGITAALTRINDSSVAGQCIHNAETPNRIVISRFYWNQIDTAKKEFLIFHELGHCILNRLHLDTKDASGNCVSIMHSADGICTFNYNTTATRNKYLDELFK